MYSGLVIRRIMGIPFGMTGILHYNSHSLNSPAGIFMHWPMSSCEVVGNSKRLEFRKESYSSRKKEQEVRWCFFWSLMVITIHTLFLHLSSIGAYSQIETFHYNVLLKCFFCSLLYQIFQRELIQGSFSIN